MGRGFELLQLKDVLLAERVFKLTCLRTGVCVCVCVCITVCTHAGLGCAIAFGLLSTSSDKQRTKRPKSLRIGPHSEHKLFDRTLLNI